MNPYLQEAVIAVEDARFFDHSGVDYKGAVRAFVANNQAGEVSQGASTLTMQYVRNQLRDAAPDPQSVVDATSQTSKRKVREMKLAIELERKMSKQQILEGYLNVAYFGHRAYGVFAAADIYFSKAPAQLTLAEAALIAGMAQAPSAYDPVSDPKQALKRRNFVISQMARVGYLSPQAARAVQAEPIALRLTDPPNDCAAVNPQHNDWGFFCDMFKQWWVSQPAFGDTPLARLDKLRTGGYKIITSLDPGIQAAGNRHVLENTGVGDRFAQGLVIVQPGTGLVKSMAVNRIYSIDQSHNYRHSDPTLAAAGVPGTYPNTVNMLLGGGGVSGYQGGSTFKMFTMLAALEKGMPLNTHDLRTREDRHRVRHRGRPVLLRRTVVPVQRQPEHDRPAEHVDRLRQVGEHLLGPGGGADRRRRGGGHGAAPRADLAHRHRPATGRSGPLQHLGRVHPRRRRHQPTGDGERLRHGRRRRRLLRAAAGAVDHHAERQVGRHDRTGREEVCWSARPGASRPSSPAVARAATDAATCTVGGAARTGSCGGWSTAPAAAAAVGRPFAGKTGTSDETRAAWFVGYTPQLAGASFVADPDNPFNPATDAQYNKPINAVTQTIRDGLRGAPVVGFAPPPPATTGSAGYVGPPPGVRARARADTASLTRSARSGPGRADRQGSGWMLAHPPGALIRVYRLSRSA